MKILHLTTHLNIGGITTYLYNLCLGLKRIGIDCSIACGSGELIDDFKKAGIAIHRIPLRTKNILSPKIPLSLWSLQRKQALEQWDIIHAHTRVAQALAHVLSRLSHIPYVTTMHGFYRHRIGRTLWPCLGDQTIAISSVVAHDILHHYPRHAARITTVLHGIQTDGLASDSPSDAEKEIFRKTIGLKPIPTLGVIARLSVEKGHLKLLEILKYLNYSLNQPAQLLIVGDGKQKELIIKKIKELDLDDRVYLLPSQKSPRMALSLIDVYVAYHEQPEAFGLAILEAMRAAKPIVVSNRGDGVTDFFENQKDGFMIESASVRQMAEKILLLLNSRQLREKMGKHGAGKIRERFSFQRMAKQTADIYEKIL